MKKHTRIFFAGIILAGVSLFGLPADAAEEASAGGTVIAYYFHGAFRCLTCRNMEQYSKEALETYFKEPLASGKLVFKAVNVEQKGQEHYVNDYRLYTKALVLSLVKDGKEVRSKNLDKIWEYARKKQRFLDYVRDEIKAFLAEA